MEKKHAELHLGVMLVFVLLCFGLNVHASVRSNDDCCLGCSRLCGYKPPGCFDSCRKNCPPNYCSGVYP